MPDFEGWKLMGGIYIDSLRGAVVAARSTTGDWVWTAARRMLSYVNTCTEQDRLCIELSTPSGLHIMVAVPRDKESATRNPPTVYMRAYGQRPNPVHVQRLVDNLTAAIYRTLRGPARNT